MYKQASHWSKHENNSMSTYAEGMLCVCGHFPCISTDKCVVAKVC